VVLREGRELVEDDERDGRPKSTRTAVNIAAVVADLLKNDSRITSRMIAESLNIPTSEVLWILKQDFDLRDFFLLHDNALPHKAASVCQFLTPENVTNLSPPELSRFISARLFSVPQVENQVKRTALSRCC
jgi:hypothetical protein